MRSLLTLVLAASAAYALAVGGAAAQKSGAEKKEAKKEAARPAPQKSPAERAKVTELKEAAGLKTLMDESAGRSRPLLVNFWATWCVPCRVEFPDLVKIRKQFAADQLDFITISLDDASEIETGVPEFLHEVGASAIPTYLLNAEDPEAAINLIDQTWRGELPATFLFDHTGAVIYSHKGRVKAADLAPVIAKAVGAKK